MSPDRLTASPSEGFSSAPYCSYFGLYTDSVTVFQWRETASSEWKSLLQLHAAVESPGLTAALGSVGLRDS